MLAFAVVAAASLASGIAPLNRTFEDTAHHRRDPTAKTLRKNSPGCGSSPPQSGWINIQVPDPMAGRTIRRFRLYVPPVSTHAIFST